jgi:hypothetical protein
MSLKLTVLRSKYKEVENQDMDFWVGHYYVMESFYESPIYQYLHHEEGCIWFLDIDTDECISASYESKNELYRLRERLVEVELCN